MANQFGVAWNDRVETAAVITASSEVAGFPGSNVGSGQPSEIWRSVTGVTTANLVFDFGASASITAVYIGNTNLTPTATLRIGISTVDATGAARNAYDSGVVPAGINIIQRRTCRFFTPASGRYGRIDLVDPNAVGPAPSLSPYLEVGKVAFLVSTWRPARGYKLGAKRMIRDFSIISLGVDGQQRVRRGSVQTGVVFSIPAFDAADFRNFAWPLLQATGKSRDVLVCLDPTDATDVGLQTFWGLLEEGSEIEHFMLKYSTISFHIWQRM